MNDSYLENRERLHARAQAAADQKSYGELFLLVSALFPASAAAQAAALSIYVPEENAYQSIRESLQQWDSTMVERLTSLHARLGIAVTISSELLMDLLTEIEELFKTFEALGITSVDMDVLEKEWQSYTSNRADSDIPRGFLEANLLFALQAAA